MSRACLVLAASVLASAISATGCAPETETSRSAIETASQGEFVDLGNGLVYQPALDITWLQDANYASTSGYRADGLMTFDEANAWATALVFGGTGGWRLPTFDPSNPRPDTDTAENEIGSLLRALTDGHFGWPSPPDTSPFVGLFVGGRFEDSIYWTGLAGAPGLAWEYYMTCG
jgi:hypothetical protein